MVGIGLGLLIVLLSVGVGALLTRRFPICGLERAAYAGAVGLALLSYGVALLAWLHWLDGLWGLLTVWGLFGIWGWRIGIGLSPIERKPAVGVNGVAWGLTGLLLGFGLVLCFLPPDGNEWDALAYHLAYPKLYLQAGGMVEVPFMHQSYFPPLVDMLFLLGLWLDGESCAKVFHWAMGLWMVLGCAGFSSRFGGYGGLAGLLVASTPVVAWQMGTAYVDLSTALYVGLGAFAVYRGLHERVPILLWLGGMMVGFALATKYTALLAWGLLGLLGLVWCFRARWWGGARTLVMTAAVAVLIGAPWYVRNWVWTGNPVYPFAYEIFGGKQWSRAQADAYRHDQLKFGMGREPYQLLLSPWNLTAHPAPFADPIGVRAGERVYLVPTMGMGYLATVGLMLAGGLSAGLGWLLLFVVGNWVGWFYLMQQVRYLILVFPILAGVGTTSIVRVPLGLQWGYTSLLGLQAGFTLWILWVGYVSAVPQALHDRDAYLLQRLQIYPAVQYLNQQVPRDAGVILLDETRGYYLNRPYLWGNEGHHRLIPYDTMRTPQSLIAWMTAHGYRFVLYNHRFRPEGEPEPWRLLYERAIAEGLLIPHFSARGVEVYEVVDSSM